MKNVKGSTSWLHEHEWNVMEIPSPNDSAFMGASRWMVRACTKCGREEININSGTNPLNDYPGAWGLTYDQFIARSRRMRAAAEKLHKGL